MVKENGKHSIKMEKMMETENQMERHLTDRIHVYITGESLIVLEKEFW